MDTRERLQILIGLAAADGELAEKERNAIISIGLANHLMVTDILPLFKEQPGKEFSRTQQKEQLLVEVVQLMQIDKKIYESELRYCANIAARLGFREQAVFEVMIRAKEFGTNEEALKRALQQYKA